MNQNETLETCSYKNKNFPTKRVYYFWKKL